MGRNDSSLVQPKTKFARMVDVGKSIGVHKPRDIFNFGTIPEAIDYMTSLGEGDNPYDGIPWVIRLSSEFHSGKIWLPSNVGMISPAALGARLIGGPEVKVGEALLGMGNSAIANIGVQPSAGTIAVDSAIYIRDSIKVYSHLSEGEMSFPLIGPKTIIVLVQGFEQQTIPLDSESYADLDEVVEAINDEADDFVASIEVGHLALDPIGSSFLSVQPEGTINSFLGFSTEFEHTSVPNTDEFMVMQDIGVIGNGFYQNGIRFTDRGGGLYVGQNMSTAGFQVGMKFDDGVQGIYRSPFPTVNIVGMEFGKNTQVELEGGRSIANGTDIVADDTGGAGTLPRIQMRAFAYKTLSGNIDIVPAASRIDYTFRLNGNYSTGPIDTSVPIEHSCTIEHISIIRVMGGSSGSTIIDIQRGDGIGGQVATTLYTTNPGDRFTFPSTDGDNKLKRTPDDAKLPSIKNLNKGEFLDVNVLQKDVGNPEGLSVKVRCVVN